MKDYLMARATAIRLQRAKLQVVEREIVALEASNAELAMEVEALNLGMEQVIEGARQGLLKAPNVGDKWSAAFNYIVGDPAVEDGVQYEATHYNKGKRPGEHPECWAVMENALPEWDSFPEMHQFNEGDWVSHDGEAWVCIDLCTKTNFFKPKTGSSKWAVG